MSHRSFDFKRMNKSPIVSIIVTQMLTHDLNLVANVLVTSAEVGSSYVLTFLSVCLQCDFRFDLFFSFSFSFSFPVIS